MGRIAIVSPMREELHTLLARMPDETAVRRAGRDFWVGHLEGHEIVAVLSNIGKVAAATTATLLLSEFDVDRIVFTGTAGGLGDGVKVGDVCVADTLMQHDMDASPLWPRFEVPLYGIARFAANREMSDALARAAEAALDTLKAPLAGFGITQRPRVHRGLMVSGDRFIHGKAANDALRAAAPDALSVEMEGAALAQVCHDFGVPYGVVRTISDRADDDAHVDFQRFVDEVASRCSLEIVTSYLRALPRA